MQEVAADRRAAAADVAGPRPREVGEVPAGYKFSRQRGRRRR